MSDQLFGAMLQSIIDGAPDKAAELARQALADGVDPLEAVNRGFAVGITFAGDQFGCGQMFLPDLLASAEAMKAAINVLEPEMLKRGSQREALGKVVLGTARGDIHDIGKNLVATILSASGFQIFDLGTSVTPEQFVAKAKEVECRAASRGDRAAIDVQHVVVGRTGADVDIGPVAVPGRVGQNG